MQLLNTMDLFYYKGKNMLVKETQAALSDVAPSGPALVIKL
jgi:hypothetical protein